MLGRAIDHLVYATNTFEETIDWFEKVSGVKPVFGGYHKTQGTKNALVRIGTRSYLEILGVDEKNKEISAPRWMGIDLIEKPSMTRWAIESNDLNTDATKLKNYKNEMGSIFKGQRKKENGDDLKWDMILPLSSPGIELAPFVIDWGDSIHPATDLEKSIELIGLKFQTNKIDKINKLFANLSIETNEVSDGHDKIIAKFKTPKGLLTIQ